MAKVGITVVVIHGEDWPVPKFRDEEIIEMVSDRVWDTLPDGWDQNSTEVIVGIKREK